MRQDLPIVRNNTIQPVRTSDLEQKLWRLMNEKGTFDAPRPAPRTSAVTAGWVCVGSGLLTAWLFPPCHVFFSIAAIMAIVAMATHQIRQGLTLLLCSMLGAGICAVVFFALVVGSVGMAVASKMPPPSRIAAPSAPSRPRGMGMATAPLTLNDVALMLRSGLRDDEILADTAEKQLVDSIGASQVAYLRSLGAGNRLVANLQLRPVYTRPAAALSSVPPPRALTPSVSFSRPVAQAGTVGSVPPPVTAPNGPAPQAGTAPASGMDPQLKPQRIEQLKTQIDALDAQVRDIRANPKDNRYWLNYYGNSNGINPQALDNYLKNLDKQRNDLRREKWQLEGR